MPKGRKRVVVEGKLLCGKCGEWKPVDEFPYNLQGSYSRSSYCQECKSKSARHTRSSDKPKGSLSPEELLKVRARKAFMKAVRRGTVDRPSSCSNPWCPRRMSGAGGHYTGHHFNYHRRFDVIHLCDSCHQTYEKARFLDLPIVVTVHQLIMEKFPDVTEDEILRGRPNAWSSKIQLSKV